MTHGETQKRRILDVGLQLWPNATARRIGRELGMSHSNVLYHFADLRDALAAHAVASGDVRVIRYLIAEKHAAISGVSEAERLEYMRG